MGRVQAIQLDYSDAFNKLMQAIRKTPSHTAHGFRVAVYKLTTCVQLLLGETPERAWFSEPELKEPLAAYFELVKAVREGNIRYVWMGESCFLLKCICMCVYVALSIYCWEYIYMRSNWLLFNTAATAPE
jgi:hypothetical protein